MRNWLCPARSRSTSGGASRPASNFSSALSLTGSGASSRSSPASSGAVSKTCASPSSSHSGSGRRPVTTSRRVAYACHASWVSRVANARRASATCAALSRRAATTSASISSRSRCQRLRAAWTTSARLPAGIPCFSRSPASRRTSTSNDRSRSTISRSVSARLSAAIRSCSIIAGRSLPATSCSRAGT